MPVIKLPAGYDVSHHEIIPDWADVFPRPLFCYTKATEGATYRDPTMPEYMAGMMSQGIHRGLYHFNRKAYTPQVQVENFCNYVRAHIDESTYLIFDVEEDETSASAMILWFEGVQAQFPNNPLALYGRAEQLNQISMTSAQKAFMRTIPLLVAGYPNNPDLFNSIPESYIPDQTKYGEVIGWQYSEKGFVQGIEGEVDLNWLAPKFVDKLIGGEVPQYDASYPFPGVYHVEGEKYGRKFYLDICDPEKVTFKVVNEYNFPSTICKKYVAQIAHNGDDWDRETYIIKDQLSPSLVFDTVPFIGKQNGKMHTSGVRLLVNGGVNIIPPNGTEAKYTEKHARTIRGIDKNGHVMTLVVDGDYPNVGVTLWQAAELMLEFDCVICFDAGGGGDSVAVYNGNVINVPDDDVNGVHFERKVPQTVLIFAEGETSMGTIGTTKGVAFAKTNIKTYGGVLKVSIGVNDLIGAYVYGTLNAAGTDLVEFDHYYKVGGTRVELGEVCKCVVQNMTITTETEGETPTEPPPPSGEILISEFSVDGSGNVKIGINGVVASVTVNDEAWQKA